MPICKDLCCFDASNMSVAGVVLYCTGCLKTKFAWWLKLGYVTRLLVSGNLDATDRFNLSLKSDVKTFVCFGKNYSMFFPIYANI